MLDRRVQEQRAAITVKAEQSVSCLTAAPTIQNAVSALLARVRACVRICEFLPLRQLVFEMDVVFLFLFFVCCCYCCCFVVVVVFWFFFGRLTVQDMTRKNRNNFDND